MPEFRAGYDDTGRGRAPPYGVRITSHHGRGRDMLVKLGDWVAGQKIYGNSRLAPDAGSWSCRSSSHLCVRDVSLLAKDLVNGVE